MHCVHTLRSSWLRKRIKSKERKRNHEREKCQKGGEKINTSTVMLIPSTRNGILIKALKEAETEMSKITRFQVRYQEAGGIQWAWLFSTDIEKGLPCGREECQTFGKDERIPNCKQANIVSLSQAAKSATRRI